MGAEHDWTWPPSMDAVVAAPGSHRVLFENDDVRVLKVTIAAGHHEPEHTHRDPTVMIVDGPGGPVPVHRRADQRAPGGRAAGDQRGCQEEGERRPVRAGRAGMGP
jgi:hypothetical protein